MGVAKTGEKRRICPSIPLFPQRKEGPLDKLLQVRTKMACCHPVRGVPSWATEKPALHFGKPGGPAPCSGKQSKITQNEFWDRRRRLINKRTTGPFPRRAVRLNPG
jgi:hypothetical protein